MTQATCDPIQTQEGEEEEEEEKRVVVVETSK